MSGVSLRDVEEVLAAEVIPTVLNQYEREPVLWPSLCEVMTPSNMPDFPITGAKGTSMAGMPEPDFRDPYEDIEIGAVGQGYVWYGRVRPISQGIVLSERDLKSLDRKGLAARLTTDSAAWGEVFATRKERHIAGMFQKGTLTAGSAEHFDGSSKDYGADPYPKVIYDGLPWFDTAHVPKHGPSGTTYSNHFTGTSLTYDNLQTVLNTHEHTNAYDERGQEILNPADTLLVPHGLRFTAENILSSMQKPGSANNDANVVRDRLQIVPWRYLSDAASSAAWWVGRRGKGIRVWDEGAPVIRASENPKNRTILVTAECYFGAAIIDWRPWSCANKAAS